MADESKTSEGSIDIPLYKDDFGVSKSNTVSVNAGSNMNSLGGNRMAFQGPSMTVPDKIVIGDDSFGSKENSADLARDLQSNGVNFETYMGGMVTPPRILTVDDTTLQFPEKVSGTEAVESHKESMQKSTNYAGTDTNRLFQENTAENDDANFRIQTELVRLNNRVTWLEKKLKEKQSSSSWKTTLVCLLTVINPILIHWLFNRKRF